MFDKLDAYNLVANLVPGAALIYALNFYGFPTPDPSQIGAFVLVSFVAGVLTNRLGSILIDPILRNPKIKFLHAKNYNAFITSEKDDPKLDTIVANAGLYRTFVTCGIIFISLILFDLIIQQINLDDRYLFLMFIVVGIIISALALRKEDDYIHQRIAARLPADDEPI